MDRIYEILEEIVPGTNFEGVNDLVDSKVLTSINIVRLVAMLNDEFDIEITPLHLLPENFNSVESIYKLVQELEEE